MLIIEPLNMMKAFKKDAVITNYKPVSETKFTVDGVFSSKIFGNLGTSDSTWICDCGELQSEFNKDIICTTCNTPVINRGLNVAREGWIDLAHIQIHPLMYVYLSKLIGVSELPKILKYGGEMETNGFVKEPELKPPYHGIGIQKFYDNFDKVMQWALDANAKKPNTVNLYNRLYANRDTIFTDKFIVINHNLRPAMVVRDEFSFDEINVYYNGLIKNSQLIKSLTKLEKTPSILEPLAFRNQEYIMDVYYNNNKVLSDKNGAIRGNLLGNRLNFTSRMVITPMDSSGKIDEIDIPYITALELCKPIILQRLSKLKNITLSSAETIFEKALVKFNNVVYRIACNIVSLPNVRLLANRNPTIAIGSILLLRIRNIKKDLNESTSSVHNLILQLIGGDYDGDVLNYVLIMSDRYCKLFEKFNPYNLIISSTRGELNKQFLPAKDTALGLDSLFN